MPLPPSKGTPKNLERLRAHQKAYRAAHREQIRAKQKAYRAKNPEKFRAYGRKYYYARMSRRLVFQLLTALNALKELTQTLSETNKLTKALKDLQVGLKFPPRFRYGKL